MFGENFRFGIGTSSYQIEGAKELRDPCIWDEFSHSDGRILDKTSGDNGIDFYHRYKEDIALAKELGIDDFRFSFSWPRLVDKDGNVKEDGIHFYQDVIKTIRDNGMNPVVTLFHWDMPSYLLEIGGFISRKILKDFTRYIEIVVENFGKSVDTWLTFNEPQCFIGLGYTGLSHAPSIKASYYQLLKASHHVLLCHSIAYKALKKENPNAQISFVNTFATPIPIREMGDINEKLAEMLFSLPESEDNFYTLSLFMDPLFLGHYPNELKDRCSLDFIKEGDMEQIQSSKPDFMALNIYTGRYFRLNKMGEVVATKSPYLASEEDSDLAWLKKRPKALTYGIKYLYERYQTPIFITENGTCYHDELIEGRVHDKKRSDYIGEYLGELSHIIDEGYPILGYYYWSLWDNFEWAEGYSKRFGLVYVDYDDGFKRYKKDSFETYKKIIRRAKNK